MAFIGVVMVDRGRYALVRGGVELSYAELRAELPIQSWPLPGSSTYAVRANADAAAHALNVRLVPENQALEAVA